MDMEGCGAHGLNARGCWLWEMGGYSQHGLIPTNGVVGMEGCGPYWLRYWLWKGVVHIDSVIGSGRVWSILTQILALRLPSSGGFKRGLCYLVISPWLSWTIWCTKIILLQRLEHVSKSACYQSSDSYQQRYCLQKVLIQTQYCWYWHGQT